MEPGQFDTEATKKKKKNRIIINIISNYRRWSYLSYTVFLIQQAIEISHVVKINPIDTKF